MKVWREIKPLEYYLELNYPITLYRAEEGGFVAEIEDLEGCLTQGETVEETTENIEEARQLWIKAAYEDRVEIPIPRTDEEYSGRFLARMPKSLHRRLTERARYEGVSLNHYVESILSAGISNQNVVDEIKTELDKISKQIDTDRAQTINYPMSQAYVRWIMGETEYESPVRGFREIKNRKRVAA